MKPDYRSYFPVAQQSVFLNHAAVSSPPVQVVEAERELFDEFSTCGIRCYSKWMDRVKETRSLFARLIHAEPEEVAFVGNTSDGLSAVAEGLRWQPGDSILVPIPDFPSNLYPWMNLERFGVKLHFVERRQGRFGPEDVEKCLRPGTKMLAVSSVDYVSGFLCDLEALGELCRRKGILFCVDAIQSLGVIPMDVKRCRIDFLAAGGHKWLLSTMGIGGLYISKEANRFVQPSRVGWKSVVDEEDFSRVHFDLKPDATRFESGTMNVAGITALGAALQLILKVGVETIRSRIFELNDAFFEELSARKLEVLSSMIPEERSGILTFVPAGDSEALFRALFEQNVMVSLRSGKIRLSPHFYNSREDVQAFFRCYDQFQQTP